ncbi:MAG: HD domain-containing protein [Bacteroidota bacterium]
MIQQSLSESQQTQLNILKKLIEERFSSHGADHDWYHIERVYQLAVFLQSKEGGDLMLVACGSLLHDISDHKLNGGILNDGGRVTRQILNDLGHDAAFAEKVAEIVDGVSFKGAGVPDQATSLEMQIVRDADRLDAMGAIGIARAFHYGGSRNRPFYSPNQLPTQHATFEAYSSDKSHTMNHFHEKLLLLKDRLHTKTAKEMGERRHQLMENFVGDFYQDWNFSGGN